MTESSFCSFCMGVVPGFIWDHFASNHPDHLWLAEVEERAPLHIHKEDDTMTDQEYEDAVLQHAEEFASGNYR